MLVYDTGYWWPRDQMRREAAGVVEWFAEAQRQQTAIDEEYTASLRAKEAEETARKAEAAVRGCGGRKGKGKEKADSGGGGATTRSKSARPRAESIAQLVISPKKKKKKT